MQDSMIERKKASFLEVSGNSGGLAIGIGLWRGLSRKYWRVAVSNPGNKK